MLCPSVVVVLAKLKSIFMPLCTVNLLIVHQIQHVIVKYARKSLPHHLKNNLSQEDIRHDNCVWWRAVVCWKLVQHGRAASAASHFKAKGTDCPLYSPRLFERVDLRPHHPHPDHVPLCVLSSARPSNPCTVPLSITQFLGWASPLLRTSLRRNIGLQLHHTYNILYISAF